MQAAQAATPLDSLTTVLGSTSGGTLRRIARDLSVLRAPSVARPHTQHRALCAEHPGGGCAQYDSIRDASACQMKCQEVGCCQFWNYHTVDKRCILKFDNGTFYAAADVVTGPAALALCHVRPCFGRTSGCIVLPSDAA